MSMMFLELEDGLAINISSVQTIERAGGKKGNRTKISTTSGSFTTNMPYEQVRDLVARNASAIQKESSRALEQIAQQFTIPVP